MAIVETRSFTPVRAPRVRAAVLPPLSLTALDALERIEQREHELRHRQRIILATGLGIILALSVAIPLPMISIAARCPDHTDTTSDTRPHPLELALCLDAVILAITFPIALFVRKESRADVASRLLDAGGRPNGTSDNPILRWVLILLLLGYLYGEFLLIDAIKTMWINARLKRVDRHRAAVILARLFTEPAGIDPRLLLQQNEPPLHLRELLAYLIVNEWADISRHGDSLTLVTPGRRALRGYRVHAGS